MLLDRSVHLYVYYRVHAAQRDACIAAVRTVHAALVQQHPGLQAALLAKSPDRLTLMETYTWAPAGTGLPAPGWDDIDARLLRCIEPFIDGRRHVEVFEPCA